MPLHPLALALGTFIVSGLWGWLHISVKSLKVQHDPGKKVPVGGEAIHWSLPSFHGLSDLTPIQVPLDFPCVTRTGALNLIPKQPSAPEGKQDQKLALLRPFLPSEAFSLSLGGSDRETKSYRFYSVVVALLMGWILAPSVPPSLPQSNFVFKSESPPDLEGILAGI